MAGDRKTGVFIGDSKATAHLGRQLEGVEAASMTTQHLKVQLSGTPQPVKPPSPPAPAKKGD
jgi:hypothetical protein